MQPQEHRYLLFHMKVLTFLNLWPRNGVLEPNPWRRMENYVFAVLLLPTSVPLYYDICGIFNESGADITMIIQSLLAGSCIIGQHYICFCFINNRNKINKLISEIPEFAIFTSLEGMEEVDGKASLYTKVLVMYSALGSTMYVLMPKLPASIEYCERTRTKIMNEFGIPCGLVARVKYPFRIDYSPLKELAYAHQIYLVFNVSMVIIIVTMLLCALLMQATSHFKILRNMLRHVYDKDHEIAAANVRRCILYHIKIIEFCKDLNETFGSQVAMHLTLPSFIISILGFELMMVEMADFIRFALHLMGWICLLLLICWYGQTLINESSKVAIDAYLSLWYKCPIKLQKDLLVLIVRAQKPITLDALNMGYMALATFLAVMKTAYSYFTLLVNIK